MTKKELVDLIADKRDLSAQMVLTVVEDFMKIIQSSAFFCVASVFFSRKSEKPK